MLWAASIMGRLPPGRAAKRRNGAARYVLFVRDAFARDAAQAAGLSACLGGRASGAGRLFVRRPAARPGEDSVPAPLRIRHRSKRLEEGAYTAPFDENARRRPIPAREVTALSGRIDLSQAQRS
jgi:hypothetical protein